MAWILSFTRLRRLTGGARKRTSSFHDRISLEAKYASGRRLLRRRPQSTPAPIVSVLILAEAIAFTPHRVGKVDIDSKPLQMAGKGVPLAHRFDRKRQGLIKGADEAGDSIAVGERLLLPHDDAAPILDAEHRRVFVEIHAYEQLIIVIISCHRRVR